MQQLVSCGCNTATLAAAVAVQPVQNFLESRPSADSAVTSGTEADTAETGSVAGVEADIEAGISPGIEAGSEADAACMPAEADSKFGTRFCQDTHEAAVSCDYVPADVISKWGHVLDIVTPHSHVTNCFTKTYSRFAKVSMLYSQQSIISMKTLCFAKARHCCMH